MAILNFPNTRDNGDPLQDGDIYTGDNGVVYTYDGAKWSGRNISTIPTSNAIANAGYVVQVDTGGNLFTPSYIFPNLPGEEGQVLTWPGEGTVLEWTNQSGTGTGITTVPITSVAPHSSNGHLWFNTVDGRAYIKYAGDWIDLSPTEVPDPATYLDGLTIDGTTIMSVDTTATVSIESNGNIWEFANDGGLTLPNGASIGSSDSLSGIPLTTDRGTILFGNQPEQCEPITLSSHFHIMKQDPGLVDLFFGDDFNYVKLPSSNGVVINTFDGVNPPQQWQFGTDGTTSFPNYKFPAAAGAAGQVLVDVSGDGTLSWQDQSGSGGGVSISDFGEGFSLTAANKIVTNKLYSTNQTQSSQHYRLELDTNGVIVLPDQSIINGSTLRGVYGTGDMNYTGITIGPDADHREESWVWVDHTGVSIATEYSTSAYTWKFDNNGVLTLPDANYVDYPAGVISFNFEGNNFNQLRNHNSTVFLEGVEDAPPGYEVYGKGAILTQLAVSGVDVSISTNMQGTVDLGNNWSFGADGTLTIPGDIQDANGSVIRIATTSTAPTRVNGQLWFNTIDGRGYIRYNDTWIDLNPTEVPDPSTYLDGLTINDTTISAVDTTATVSIESGANVWEFGIDGSLTFPGLLQAPQRTITTSTDTGVVGQMCWDDDNIYVYTSTGWKKSALSII